MTAKFRTKILDALTGLRGPAVGVAAGVIKVSLGAAGSVRAAQGILLAGGIVLIATSDQDPRGKAIQLLPCLAEMLSIFSGRDAAR